MKSKALAPSLHSYMSFSIRHLIYALFSLFVDKERLEDKIMTPFRKKLLDRLPKEFIPPSKAKNVMRVKDPKNYINPEIIRNLTEPIVIEQGCKGWQAQKKWCFDYLKKTHGEIMLRGAKSQKDATRINLSLKKALERIHEHNPAFTNFEPLVETNEQLKRDLKLYSLSPLVSNSSRFSFYTITFLGPKNYCSGLHMDISNNFLINVWGKREVRFYSHDQTPLLYPSPEIPTHGYSYFSDIPSSQIFQSSELSAFPLYKYAKPVTAILNPGDILYIPAFTWHAVKYLENCIGVAAGFRNLPQAFKTSPIFTLLSGHKYMETFFLK